VSTVRITRRASFRRLSTCICWLATSRAEKVFVLKLIAVPITSNAITTEVECCNSGRTQKRWGNPAVMAPPSTSTVSTIKFWVKNPVLASRLSFS
jgi:hypothetical protein